MNIRKNLPKVLSAAMSLMILCSGVSMASFAAGVESTGTQASAPKTDEAKKADETKAKEAKKYNKEETVYVISDANGNPNKVIVSDWIKNTEGAKKIKDISNLKDVETVKGDNSYTINEKNSYEWDANGSDIYYKGTGTAELPVGVNIVYMLDGKETSPKELAGKSGKLKMKITYTNRKYEEKTVNAKKEKIYVPFVMLTGMMLDNEKFSNVAVSNGKVINDGSHTYVAGFALPGMQDTLKLKSDELDIPSTVEITADVKDFELATTLTVATNDMFNDFDTTKLDKKAKDLNKQLNELSDATEKLLDGTSQLYTGLSTLLDKSGELIDGIDKLYSGAKQIKSGTESLSNGTDTLSAGASKLNSGVGELSGGAGTLDDGAYSLKNGAAQVDSGAGSLAGGASKLDSGVAELQGYIASLSGGLNKISSNSSSLKAGAKQVFNTLLSTADTQIAAAGLTADKLTIENYGKVLSGLIASMSDENAQKYAYGVALNTVTATVNSQKDVIRQGVENAVRKQVTEGVLAAAGLSMTAEQYDAAVAAGQIPEETQAQISQAVSTQMTAMQGTIDSQTEAQITSIIDKNMKSEEVQKQISEGAAKMTAGRKSLEALKTQLDSYNTFYKGIIDYTDGVDKASGGAKDILSGTGTLKSGTSELKSGADKLKSGTSTLSSGASHLKNDTGTLRSGAGELKNGSSQLEAGAKKLSSGAKTLDSGTGELVTGIFKLKSGSGALIDGITKLKEGSMTLNKGMKEYKEKGVDKLKKAADGDLKSLVERIKAISDVSKNYKSYSGLADDADGKVDFIFKTDGIEKDK